MAVKYTTKKNMFPKMEANIKKLHGKNIKVGHLDGGEQAWLAGIHEYGCDIEITPEMRAWLQYNGLHVKDSTTHIHIPERAFLRNGFDEHHKAVVDKCEKALGACLAEGNIDPVLDSVGVLLRDKIRDYGVDLRTPPNHPFTIERKGSSNPLVGGGDQSDNSNGGDMLEALTYEVE